MGKALNVEGMEAAAQAIYDSMCGYVGPNHDNHCIENVLLPWIISDNETLYKLEAENAALKAQLAKSDCPSASVYDGFKCIDGELHTFGAEPKPCPHCQLTKELLGEV